MELYTPSGNLQHICLHLNAPRALLLYHCPTSSAQRITICSYVFISESNYALGFMLTTMVKNDCLIVQSGIFSLHNLPPLLILSITHFCHRISSFSFYVITITLDLVYPSMNPHSPSTSRGKNFSNVQSRSFAHLGIYSFL